MKKLLIGAAVVALLGLGIVAYAQTSANPMGPGAGWGWCATDAPAQHGMTHGHHGMHRFGHGAHYNFRGGHHWQTDAGHQPGWCWNQPESRDTVE
ncbi:MAG: hypothetical protein ACP5KN_10525 [Armatimonadota bacterium]